MGWTFDAESSYTLFVAMADEAAEVGDSVIAYHALMAAFHAARRIDDLARMRHVGQLLTRLGGEMAEAGAAQVAAAVRRAENEQPEARGSN